MNGNEGWSFIGERTQAWPRNYSGTVNLHISHTPSTSPPSSPCDMKMRETDKLLRQGQLPQLILTFKKGGKKDRSVRINKYISGVYKYVHIGCIFMQPAVTEVEVFIASERKPFLNPFQLPQAAGT